MRVVLCILFGLVLLSCGSRKVSTRKSIHEVEIQQQSELVSDVQLKVFDSFVQRFSKKEFKLSASEISVTPDGGVTIKESVLDSSSSLNVTEVGSILNVSDQTKVEENVSEVDLTKESGKDVERKQFSWWGIVIIVMIVFFVFLRYK